MGVHEKICVSRTAIHHIDKMTNSTAVTCLKMRATKIRRSSKTMVILTEAVQHV